MSENETLLPKRTFVEINVPSKVRNCAVPDHLRSEIYLAHLQHSKTLEKQ